MIFYPSTARFRYPSAFVDTQYQKFLIKHQLKPMRVSPPICDNNTYAEARRAILRLPTASQSQHNRNFQNVVLDPIDVINAVIANLIDEPSSKAPPASRPYQPKLILHYHHERRLTPYKKDVHQLWSQTLDRTPLPVTRLIVGHRNHSNLKRELIRKKPKLLSRLKC